MRLWHTDMIPVLPKEQLVAQWRECSAIAGSIQKNGTPNHILVNFMLDYDYDHFISYCAEVRQEMTKRGYRTMDKVWDKIVGLKINYSMIDTPYPEIMNEEYYTICYYNLYEKYIRGGISQEDWNKISQRS